MSRLVCELLVVPHAIAGAADVGDATVMHEPIDERRGHHVVAKDLTTLSKSLFDVSTVARARSGATWVRRDPPPAGNDVRVVYSPAPRVLAYDLLGRERSSARTNQCGPRRLPWMRLS
jgi:hypothetical protein